jgi:tRNA dimethylallyltransferase
MTLRVAVILGPTATGKTRLAVTVAHGLGSEIVSADSRQVYTGLDLGTGKDLYEYRSVSPPVAHHLIDICDPRDTYTVFDFQRDCYRVIEDRAGDPRLGEGTVPLLLVGGSGLYIEAVIRGYRIADVPEDPELRSRLMERSHADLVEELRRWDPERAAATDLASKKRVVRALEVAEHRGKAPLALSKPPPIDVTYAVFGVEVERDVLRARIAERVERRLALGMVDEVRRLLDCGVGFARLQMLGMEYREISSYLRGDVTYHRMVSNLKRKIGQLAKRQMTYFRGMERRGIPIHWLGPDDLQELLDHLAPTP